MVGNRIEMLPLNSGTGIKLICLNNPAFSLSSDNDYIVVPDHDFYNQVTLIINRK